MAKFNGKYRIESARAKWWDYKNEGYYFITICAKNRQHLFGYVKDGKMILNEYGTIVSECWYDLPNHYPNIVLDAFQIMPNHIHCIVGIDNSVFNVETGLKCASTNDVVEVEETGFKPVCTESVCVEINESEIKEIKIHGVFEFMRALKSFSSRKINEIRGSKGISNWQERFHDHIITKETEYNNIKNYIINNPEKWEDDSFYSPLS